MTEQTTLTAEYAARFAALSDAELAEAVAVADWMFREERDAVWTERARRTARRSSAYDQAVTVTRVSHDTTAQNVRLGDHITRVGTVTSVQRFGGQMFIEGTRDMIVKMPDSPVTLTRESTGPRWIVRLRHDHGTVEITMCARSAEEAERRVCLIEGAPRRAVIGTRFVG